MQPKSDTIRQALRKVLGRRSDAVTTATADGHVCAVIFDSGYPCHVTADHPVHRGEWPRPEPNHDFVPLERRFTADRRAALAADDSPSAEGTLTDEQVRLLSMRRAVTHGAQFRAADDSPSEGLTRVEAVLSAFDYEGTRHSPHCNRIVFPGSNGPDVESPDPCSCDGPAIIAALTDPSRG